MSRVGLMARIGIRYRARSPALDEIDAHEIEVRTMRDAIEPGSVGFAARASDDVSFDSSCHDACASSSHVPPSPASSSPSRRTR